MNGHAQGEQKGYKLVVASGTHGKREPIGSVLGLFTFLGGISLLLLTFRLAYDMFEVPPRDALQIGQEKVLNPAVVGNSVTVIIVQIVLLLIMGIVGSLIANRGITLFTHSRGIHIPKDKKSEISETHVD